MPRISNLPYKLARRYRHLVADWRGRFGLDQRLFREARGARLVVYHGICKSEPLRFNSLFVDLPAFENHLRFYAEYFHLLSLDDYFAGRFSDDRFNICITFDDGFANNYQYALPLMRRYSAPMAFFVTGTSERGDAFLWNDWLSYLQKYGPGFITFPDGTVYTRHKGRYIAAHNGLALRDRLQNGDFAEKETLIRHLGPLPGMEAHEEYWRQMSREQLRTLALDPLATIGCHGYYHNDLARIPLASAVEELRLARTYLDSLTRKPVHALAFPYGSYSRELVSAADELGFDQQLALDLLFPEDHPDPRLRPRMVINPYISITNQMTAIIHGNYR